MYESVIKLDESRWQRQGLDAANNWHRWMWNMFPGRPDESRKFLFKMFCVARKYIVLLDSQHCPDCSGVEFVSADVSKRSAVELREYSFAVRANPMTRNGGRERFLADIDDQKKWFIGKMKGVDIVHVDVRHGRKICVDTHCKNITVNPVDFTGTLTVKERGEFERVRKEGVGRKKNYGMGLVLLSNTTRRSNCHE